MRAEPHRTFNSCSDLKGLTKDEIVDGLRSQGVLTDCFHITVKSDNNNTDRRKTNTFILTFNMNTASAHISVGYLRVKVDRYIPNPLGCFKYQKMAIVPDCVEMTQSAIAVVENIQRSTATMLPNVQIARGLMAPPQGNAQCGSENKKYRG